MFEINTSGQIDCVINFPTTAACADDGAALTVGRWHHLAWTVNRSGNAVRYLDGVKTGTDADISAHSATSVNVADDFCIGARATGCVSRNLDAHIDDARVYNYVRTPAQVAWDYNQGKPVAQYKFDECSGNTVYDSAPKADPRATRNDGTITIGGSGSQDKLGNCVTTDTAAAWYNGRNGKYNSALNFDGTNDYVDLHGGSFGTLLSNTSNTVSAWVKLSSVPAEAYILRDADSSGLNSSLSLGTFSGQWHFNIYGSGGNASVNAGTADTNWHHLVGVFDDAANTVRLYLDTVQIGSNSQTNTMVNGTSKTIGRSGDEASGYIPGQLDDVRIYNYPLTQTQIKTLYNENSAVRFGPLTGSP